MQTVGLRRHYQLQTVDFPIHLFEMVVILLTERNSGGGKLLEER